MDFYESDLEDIIFHSLRTSGGVEKLKLLGLEIKDTPIRVFRQLRIGNYGIADIVTVSKWYFSGIPKLLVTVYELKKNGIDEKALIQAYRYVTGISHYLRNRGINNVIIEPVLIGRSVANSDWVYLMGNDPLCDVFTYEYKIDGMRFNQQPFSYNLVEPNFK